VYQSLLEVFRDADWFSRCVKIKTRKDKPRLRKELNILIKHA